MLMFSGKKLIIMLKCGPDEIKLFIYFNVIDFLRIVKPIKIARVFHYVE